MSANKVMSATQDDEPPRDIDAFRFDLARRINIIVGNEKKFWRDCPEKACRRARACRAPKIQCSNSPPPPKMTAEEEAEMLARFRRALEAENGKREKRNEA